MKRVLLFLVSLLLLFSTGAYAEQDQFRRDRSISPEERECLKSLIGYVSNVYRSNPGTSMALQAMMSNPNYSACEVKAIFEEKMGWRK